MKDNPTWFGMDLTRNISASNNTVDSTAGESNLTLETLNKAMRAMAEARKETDDAIMKLFWRNRAHPDTHYIMLHTSQPRLNTSYSDSIQYNQLCPVDKLLLIPKPKSILR